MSIDDYTETARADLFASLGPREWAPAIASYRQVPYSDLGVWRPAAADGTIHVGLVVWRDNGTVTLIKVIATDFDERHLQRRIRTGDLEREVERWQRRLSNLAVVSAADLTALGMEWE